MDSVGENVRVNSVLDDLHEAAGVTTGKAAVSTQARWWDGLVCGLIVVLATLSARPFVGMGFCDDYAYIKMARDFALTGRMIYNGGTAVVTGWQIPWGALFIRLFGFSFTAPRMSTLVVAFFVIWLFFVTLVRFGISRRGAYFGALLFGLSPIFVPMAASFMTDIDSVFVIVLCMYLCKRAFDARTPQSTIAWLAAAAVTNVAAGTVRQVTWLGALVMAPAVAWALRRRRGVLVSGVVLWALSAVAILAIMHWFKQQPYVLNDPIISLGHRPVSLIFGHGAMQYIKDFLVLALLIFPLLVAWVLRMKLRPAVAALIVGVVVAFEFVSLHFDLRFHQFPWMRDVMGNLGMSQEFSWALGTNHLVFNEPTQFVLACIVTAAAVLFLVDLWRGRASSRRAAQESSTGSANGLFWICVPFVAVYLTMLVPRSLWNGVLDRYLLGVLPFVILAFLKLYEKRFSSRLPVASYIVLAAMTGFTIAATHDWFSLDRARLEAAETLERAGVPRTAMQVGLEFDGWTQLDHSPTIVDAWIRVPAGVYKVKPLPNLRGDCILWDWNQAPVVDPKYFVVISPMSCFARSSFAPVGYTTWLPPFHREVYIEQYP
jgi:Dolichyl-phosphate-mannose-protein mannosyltransferase